MMPLQAGMEDAKKVESRKFNNFLLKTAKVVFADQQIKWRH
jgi:hypothetical protein